MRILLVEDDPMIGKTLLTALQQDGYTVDWVKDGQAGRWRSTPRTAPTRWSCSTSACRKRAGSNC